MCGTWTDRSTYITAPPTLCRSRCLATRFSEAESESREKGERERERETILELPSSLLVPGRPLLLSSLALL
eukprot:9470422-Pyramimonas_sp.AAC.1